MDTTEFLHRLLENAVIEGDAYTVSTLRAYADAQADAASLLSRAARAAMRKMNEASDAVSQANEAAEVDEVAPTPAPEPTYWTAPELLQAHKLGHKIVYKGNGKKCKRMEAPAGKNQFAEEFDMVAAYLPSYPNGLLTDASQFLVVPKNPNA